MILAIILSLLAAVLNATWNTLLKTTGDPMVTATRAMSASAIVATPLAAIAWLASGRPPMPPAAWGLAAASSVFEFCYFLCLTTAYRRGELSVVYPLARGTAPLLAVLAGAVFLRETLTSQHVMGVAFLLIGILVVRRPSRAPWAVMWPALLTGVAIATYSAIDKEGTSLAPPWLYGWALWAMGALLLVAWAGIVRWRRGPDQPGEEAEPPPDFLRGVVIGVCMLIGYLLVLIALSLAPLVVVAPLRESGIVLVAAVSAVRLGERNGLGLRIGGSVAILCGAVALAV